jgi:hypothetical protein
MRLVDSEDVQASAAQDLCFEEVTCQQRFRLAAQEAGPGGALALGSWVDAVFLEDFPDS